MTGWGAKLGAVVTGGHWDMNELDHINCFELKAVLMGLKSICKDFRDTHIRLRSDNMTTIACIDRCGSTKILLTIVEHIFEWVNMKNITISLDSRISIWNGCWILIFLRKHANYSFCRTDLFATRINTQLTRFVSWKPDPDAYHTNAFTHSWTEGLTYAFPPFNIIGRVLKKDPRGQGNPSGYPSALADTNLVLKGTAVISGGAGSTPKAVRFSPTRSSSRSPTTEQAQANSNGIVRESFESQRVSSKVAEFLLESWRNGTKQQYGSHIKR